MANARITPRTKERLASTEAVPGKHYPRTWKLSRENAESTEIGGLPSGISRLLLGSQVPQQVLCTRLNVLFLRPSQKQPLFLSWVSTPMLQAPSCQPACFLLFLPCLLFRAVHTFSFPLSPTAADSQTLSSCDPISTARCLVKLIPS